MRATLFVGAMLVGLMMLPGCGDDFDCAAACDAKLTDTWIPGVGYGPILCDADAIKNASDCTSCDAAIAEATGMSRTSTCE